LPRFVRVRQNFSRPPALDLPAAVESAFVPLSSRIKPGARIAVGVGSRGISNLSTIVGGVLDALRRAGAQPFILPAMGSHGGATPDGQCGVLATYGITEAALGVPIRASLDVKQVGVTDDGVPVWCSTEALGADGLLLINRVKPHTDFSSDRLGSGLLKMAVVGLGKRSGAAAMHLAAAEFGHERAIETMAAVLLKTAPILGGIAIIEDQFHATARIVGVPAEEIFAEEPRLFAEARRLMPLLPFDDVDLLIVDRIGKNISGTGMDPNVIQRSIDGYSTSLQRAGRPSPFIRRIFVRDLTPETHGNALGVGLADAITSRLMQAADWRVTAVNSLTALTPVSAKIPMHFATDRDAIEAMLGSVAPRVGGPWVVWIADTLSLAEFSISEALAKQPNAALTPSSEPAGFVFDRAGNLL
jgi:hypothetical protein